METRSKADLPTTLPRAWYHLRLSVRDPTRVRTWDAIILTAASPDQADLYNCHLSRAKRMGRIASSTVTLAVPDPHGQRIGSGAATLNALHALATHLSQSQVTLLVLIFSYSHLLPNYHSFSLNSLLEQCCCAKYSSKSLPLPIGCSTKRDPYVFVKYSSLDLVFTWPMPI